MKAERRIFIIILISLLFYAAKNQSPDQLRKKYVRFTIYDVFVEKNTIQHGYHLEFHINENEQKLILYDIFSKKNNSKLPHYFSEVVNFKTDDAFLVLAPISGDIEEESYLLLYIDQPIGLTINHRYLQHCKHSHFKIDLRVVIYDFDPNLKYKMFLLIYKFYLMNDKYENSKIQIKEMTLEPNVTSDIELLFDTIFGFKYVEEQAKTYEIINSINENSKDNIPTKFTSELSLNIEIMDGNGDSIYTNKSVIVNKSVDALPYKYYHYDVLQNDWFSYKIFIHNEQYGYQGYHSNKHCTPVNNLVRCDDSGNYVCRNPNFNNPPDCDKEFNPCKTDSCDNGGTCESATPSKENPSLIKCTCPPEYFGIFCEKKYHCEHCKKGHCIQHNVCEICRDGWTGSSCRTRTIFSNMKCINGSPMLFGKRQICKCDNSRYIGRFCQMRCDSICNSSVCYSNKNIIYCFPDLDNNVSGKYSFSQKVLIFVIFLITISLFLWLCWSKQIIQKIVVRTVPKIKKLKFSQLVEEETHNEFSS